MAASGAQGSIISDAVPLLNMLAVSRCQNTHLKRILGESLVVV